MGDPYVSAPTPDKDSHGSSSRHSGVTALGAAEGQQDSGVSECLAVCLSEVS